MKFLNLEFKINSAYNKKETITKIEKLLIKRAVKIEVKDNIIMSKRISIPILNFDPRNYSRNNWIGINPFISISSIKIILAENNPSNTYTKIYINRFRAVIKFLCILFLALFIFISIPFHIFSIVFLTIITLVAFLWLFFIVTNRLIIEEIKNVLKK